MKVVKTSRRPALMVVLYALIGGLLFVVLSRLPESFLPTEDQGSVMLQATLPSGATASRTATVNHAVTDWFLAHEKNNVDVIFTIDGFNFSGLRKMHAWPLSSSKTGVNGRGARAQRTR